MLHFAAKFHGEAAKGHCRGDKLRQLALEHIILVSALGRAWPDPLVMVYGFNAGNWQLADGMQSMAGLKHCR